MPFSGGRHGYAKGAEMNLVEALRSYSRADEDGVEVNTQTCDEAADMLEFFFSQMQMNSPQMNGQHSYRFRSGGWPMTHCKGPNAEDAVKAAIQEIKRERKSSA
jgi:hypothetical protein